MDNTLELPQVPDAWKYYHYRVTPAGPTSTTSGYCPTKPANLDAKPISNKYDSYFMNAGKKYGIDWRILKAIGAVESSPNLNPNAISPTGMGVGVMQVNPAAHPQWSIDQLKDPSINIDAGASVLAGFIKHTNGSVAQAVLDYNGGNNASITNTGSKNYLLKVNSYLNELTGVSNI